MRTQVTFTVHKIRITGYYSCICGHRFKRIKTGEWTENPYHKIFMKHGFHAANMHCRQQTEAKLKEQQCPKCGDLCEVKRYG